MVNYEITRHIIVWDGVKQLVFRLKHFKETDKKYDRCKVYILPEK